MGHPFDGELPTSSSMSGSGPENPNPFLCFHIQPREIDPLAFFLHPDNHSLSFNNRCWIRQDKRHSNRVALLKTRNLQLNAALTYVPRQPAQCSVSDSTS